MNIETKALCDNCNKPKYLFQLMTSNIVNKETRQVMKRVCRGCDRNIRMGYLSNDIFRIRNNKAFQGKSAASKILGRSQRIGRGIYA